MTKNDWLKTLDRLTEVNLDNLDADTNFKNSFSICLSAFKIIRDGWETEAIPETGKKNIEKIGFFAKIFGIR